MDCRLMGHIPLEEREEWTKTLWGVGAQAPIGSLQEAERRVAFFRLV